MSYYVIRTIKKRQYKYLQTSVRIGKKVKTINKYLGPLISDVTVDDLKEKGLVPPNYRGPQEKQNSNYKDKHGQTEGEKYAPVKPIPVTGPQKLVDQFYPKGSTSFKQQMDPGLDARRDANVVQGTSQAKESSGSATTGGAGKGDTDVSGEGSGGSGGTGD